MSNFKTYKESSTYPRYSSVSQILNILHNHNGKTVLDIGCSEGYMGKLDGNNLYIGVDYKQEILDSLPKEYFKKYLIDLNQDPRGIDKVDELADFVVMADFLEHILYPEMVLQSLKKNINPSTALLISLPNVGLWRVRLNLLFGRFDYTDYGVMDSTHLRFYTKKNMIKLLKDAGYKIDSIKGAANLLGPLVKFVPILDKLFSTQFVIVAHYEG